jgi:hypothetical protein
MIFQADVTFDTKHAPFLHQDYHYLQIDSNKLPLERHRLGVSSGTSKMISEPMVCSAQTQLLYCTDSNTVSKRTETRLHKTHSHRSSIGCVQDNFRSDGTFDTNRAHILRQDYHYLQTDSNKLPLEPMVCSAQTVLLYCTDTNTILERTKTRFHMTHSPRSSIGCVQHDLRAYGTFGRNRAPILRQDLHYLQMDSNKLPIEPRHLKYQRVCQKQFLSQRYIRRKPSSYIAPTLTLSPNGPKRDSM